MSYGYESPNRNRQAQPAKKEHPIVKFLVVILVLVIAVVGFGIGVQLTGKSFEGCLVNDKALTKEGKMFVYTENCGDMKVDLNPLLGAASTKEVYDQIVPGDIYDMTLMGIQVDALSILPNILTVEKIGTTNPEVVPAG